MAECVRQMTHDGGAVNAVRFSGDGQYCMSCGDDKSIRLWNPHKTELSLGGAKKTENSATSGMQIKAYKGAHGYGVLDLCIAHDNAKFASVGGDRAAFYWDVASGRVVRKLQGHTHRINSVCMNAESTVLITASYDKTVRLWDLRSSSREPIQTIDSFSDSVSSAAAADDKITAACVDGAVRTFDLRAGLMHIDSFAPSSPIVFVSITEDSKCAVLSSIGGIARLIDLASGRELQRYTGHVIEAYKSEACVATNPLHVVSGSEDGRLLTWSLINAATVLEFKAHGKGVSSLSCHPKDDTLLMTASFDGDVKMWKLPRLSVT